MRTHIPLSPNVTIHLVRNISKLLQSIRVSFQLLGMTAPFQIMADFYDFRALSCHMSITTYTLHHPLQLPVHATTLTRQTHSFSGALSEFPIVKIQADGPKVNQ